MAHFGWPAFEFISCSLALVACAERNFDQVEVCRYVEIGILNSQSSDGGSLPFYEGEVCGDRCIRFNRFCEITAGSSSDLRCHFNGSGGFDLSYRASVDFTTAVFRIFDKTGSLQHESSTHVGFREHPYIEDCGLLDATFHASFSTSPIVDSGTTGASSAADQETSSGDAADE